MNEIIQVLNNENIIEYRILKRKNLKQLNIVSQGSSTVLVQNKNTIILTQRIV